MACRVISFTILLLLGSTAYGDTGVGLQKNPEASPTEARRLMHELVKLETFILQRKGALPFKETSVINQQCYLMHHYDLKVLGEEGRSFCYEAQTNIKSLLFQIQSDDLHLHCSNNNTMRFFRSYTKVPQAANLKFKGLMFAAKIELNTFDPIQSKFYFSRIGNGTLTHDLSAEFTNMLDDYKALALKYQTYVVNFYLIEAWKELYQRNKALFKAIPPCGPKPTKAPGRGY